MSKRFLPFIWLLLTVAAIGAGVGVNQWLGARAPASRDYHAYEPPLPLPEFMLTDHAGQLFDRSRFAGRWSFVFFGYTHCPDVCPAAMTLFQQLQRKLGPDAPVQYVLVSVDPERDTPAHLGAYVRHFSPAFVGATGPHAEIARLTGPLGVHYARGPERDGLYEVEHSSAIFLVGPDARLRAVFTAPQDVAKMAAGFARLKGA
ncbi:electron transporter SenC [Sulfurifustis variabilis]|uniref:Electron transporter SenC n=1 Tax=Sulfurifustis variabilis TaxID=1675686 RepID=A0A1B4V0T5_9GAMM|nr:SCO family protein [Sulfurifustis variabilis]BAU46825.1 electron transporter SenC [Sulfurifustis variabilis]